MKRVMCLNLLNWPVQRQLRQKQHASAERPSRIAIHTPLPTSAENKSRCGTNNGDLKFVRELFPAARGGPAIVFVSDDAWTAGIRPGMPLAEARSMAAPTTGRRSASTPAHVETTFIEWDPSADQDELKAIAELVRRFAPIVGLDATPVSDSLLLDITGCAPLFGGEAALAEQLLKRLELHRLQCRVAISDSVATAWAFAHAEGHALQAIAGATARRRPRNSSPEWDLPVVVIPPQQSETWLYDLPVASARIPTADTEVLSQLGILNLKQLFHLPLEDLPTRVSPESIRRLRQIRSFEDELITAIPEANPITASWTSEFPATNESQIHQILEHLVGDIAEQLRRRRVGAIRLTCRLKPEEGRIVPLIAEVVKPVQSAEELLEVLLLRLEFLKIPATLSVNMRASVAPLPIARQQDLFSPSEHIEPAEELATVVNRISNRLGKDVLLTAEFSSSPVPENSMHLRPLIEGGPGKSAGNIDDRLSELVTPETPLTEKQSAQNVPLRLLSQPVCVAEKGVSPLETPFRWNATEYVTAGVTGPNRIQTDWWNDDPVHRDYYQVTTQSGSTFWIYLDLNNDSWYLHGVFD